MVENLQFGPEKANLLKKLSTLQAQSRNLSMKLENTNGENWNWGIYQHLAILISPYFYSLKKVKI